MKTLIYLMIIIIISAYATEEVSNGCCSSLSPRNPLTFSYIVSNG